MQLILHLDHSGLVIAHLSLLEHIHLNTLPQCTVTALQLVWFSM